jgi:hypothetical protein
MIAIAIAMIAAAPIPRGIVDMNTVCASHGPGVRDARYRVATVSYLHVGRHGVESVRAVMVARE